MSIPTIPDKSEADELSATIALRGIYSVYKDATKYKKTIPNIFE